MRAAPLSLHKPRSTYRASTRRTRAELDALVLDLLGRSNRPVSAYDLASLSVGTGRPIVPNQVYRTLDRLMEQGLVQRVESLSAYLLKQHCLDGYLICDHCHAIQFLSEPRVVAGLADCAAHLGFSVGRTVVEIFGQCRDCAADGRGTCEDQTTSSPAALP
jgi:Fur family zinc uptake transcriptional regulator